MDRSAAPAMAKLLFGTMERAALPLNGFACGDVRGTSISRAVAKGQLVKPNFRPPNLLARPHRRFRAAIIAHAAGRRGLVNRSGLDVLFQRVPRDVRTVLRDSIAAESGGQNHRGN